MCVRWGLSQNALWRLRGGWSNTSPSNGSLLGSGETMYPMKNNVSRHANLGIIKAPKEKISTHCLGNNSRSLQIHGTKGCHRAEYGNFASWGLDRPPICEVLGWIQFRLGRVLWIFLRKMRRERVHSWQRQYALTKSLGMSGNAVSSMRNQDSQLHSFRPLRLQCAQ